MLNSLQREMDGFWRARFRLEELPFPTGRGNDANADFMPRMDVYEQNNNNTIVVKAELPGPKQNDVQAAASDASEPVGPNAR